MIIRRFEYKGKQFEYDEDATTFLLEVGRLMNAYIVAKCIADNHEEAIKQYEAYHVSNGYKKRLSMKTGLHAPIKITHKITKKEK